MSITQLYEQFMKHSWGSSYVLLFKVWHCPFHLHLINRKWIISAPTMTHLTENPRKGLSQHRPHCLTIFISSGTRYCIRLAINILLVKKHKKDSCALLQVCMWKLSQSDIEWLSEPQEYRRVPQKALQKRQGVVAHATCYHLCDRELISHHSVH